MDKGESYGGNGLEGSHTGQEVVERLEDLEATLARLLNNPSSVSPQRVGSHLACLERLSVGTVNAASHDTPGRDDSIGDRQGSRSAYRGTGEGHLAAPKGFSMITRVCRVHEIPTQWPRTRNGGRSALGAHA